MPVPVIGKFQITGTIKEIKAKDGQFLQFLFFSDQYGLGGGGHSEIEALQNFLRCLQEHLERRPADVSLFCSRLKT